MCWRLASRLLSDFVYGFTHPVSRRSIVANEVIDVPAGSPVLDATAADFIRFGPDNLRIVSHAIDVAVD